MEGQLSFIEENEMLFDVWDWRSVKSAADHAHEKREYIEEVRIYEESKALCLAEIANEESKKSTDGSVDNAKTLSRLARFYRKRADYCRKNGGYVLQAIEIAEQAGRLEEMVEIHLNTDNIDNVSMAHDIAKKTRPAERLKSLFKRIAEYREKKGHLVEAARDYRVAGMEQKAR